MLRYLRLYAYFLRFSFSRAMEFRFDFFFRIVMDLIYYAVNIAFFRILHLHTNLLGGWNQDQMMIFVSGFLLIDAIFMTLCSNNMWALPFLINKGDLDYYAVRPVSTLFFVTLRDFAANSFVNLVMALGIFAWAVGSYPGEFGPGRVLLYLLFILNGTYLYACVRLLMILPVFWTHSSRGLDQVFWGLTKFMERPDGIFKGWVRRILVTIVPFSLMASFPTRLVIGEFDWTILAHLIVMTGVFTLIVRWAWNQGLRSYSSASS